MLPASARSLASSAFSIGGRRVWRGDGLSKMASVIKAFIDRPDLSCLANSSPRSPSGGRYEIGDERFLFFGSVIPLPYFLVCRSLLAHSSRRKQTRVRGRYPGRWVCIRERRYLPLLEAGAETPVAVQGRNRWSRVARGAEVPLLNGSRESEVSLAVMQRRHVALSQSSLNGGCWLTNPLSPNMHQAWTRFRDSEGVSTGDGKSPSKVGVVLPRTPCTQTYVFSAPPTFHFTRPALPPAKLTPLASLAHRVFRRNSELAGSHRVATNQMLRHRIYRGQELALRSCAIWHSSLSTSDLDWISFLVRRRR